MITHHITENSRKLDVTHFFLMRPGVLNLSVASSIVKGQLFLICLEDVSPTDLENIKQYYIGLTRFYNEMVCKKV